MLTEQHIAEDLSRAYVQAVAAKAGVGLDIRFHDYGMDGSFHHVQVINGNRSESGFPIDFQLKASRNWNLENGHVRYDLEVRTYNILVERSHTKAATPAILILLCLPTDPVQWLELNEDQLLLRKCCYWDRLAGEPSANLSTVRISIPRSRLLTPGSLQALFEQVRTGELV